MRKLNKTLLRKGFGPLEKLIPPRGYYLLKKPDDVIKTGDLIANGNSGWTAPKASVGDKVISWSGLVACRRGKAPKASKVVLPTAPQCPALPRFVRVSIQDKIRAGDLICDGSVLSNGGYWEAASGFVGKSCLEIKAAMGLTVWACRCVQVGGAA